MAPVPVERRAAISAVELPKTFFAQGDEVVGRVVVRAREAGEVELTSTLTDRCGRELARQTARGRINGEGAIAFALRPRVSRNRYASGELSVEQH
jgi:hypothetical protein